jgi:uncharacterized membrane protein
MRVRESGILVAAVIAVLALISTVSSTNPVLRALVGLPLIFYLPGYVIFRAAFVPPPATGLTGMVFAAGLSMVVTVFCGFALHLTGGLTPEGWLLALGGVTLAGGCVAFLRTGRSSFSQRTPVSYPALGAIPATMMVCAVAITAGAVMLVRESALAHPEFAYTELWMVPAADSSQVVTIGIKNRERTPSGYDLQVTLDDRIVMVRRSILLRVGESWTFDLALKMRSHAAHKAEARLFKDGDDELVYRRVWLRTGPETR